MDAKLQELAANSFKGSVAHDAKTLAQVLGIDPNDYDEQTRAEFAGFDRVVGAKLEGEPLARRRAG